MQFLTDLWLAILVTSVVLFFCSFMVWAVLNHHKDDWAKLPDEEGVRKFLKDQSLPSGTYIFPKMDHKDCNTPEGKAKMKDGPMGELRVWKDRGMGGPMAATFTVFLVASFLVAYVSWHVLRGHGGHAPDATFVDRFQVIGTIGILTYCFSFIPNMVWFQAGKRAIINGIIDGLLYGIVTGATFSWLWPKAVAAVVP